MRYVNSEYRERLRLDLQGLKLPEFKDKSVYAPYLDFLIGTYDKVCTGDCTWDVVFRPANNFLESLSKEDKAAIATFLLTQHHILRKAESYSNEDYIAFVGGMDGLVQLDNQINLWDKVVNYANANIPINETKNAGKSAQDTPIMTYHREHLLILIAFSLVAKLMVPILGTIMCEFIKRKRPFKEMYTVPIVLKLFNKKVPDHVHKLQHYVGRIVRSTYEESITASNNMFTVNSVEQSIFASVLIRNYINIDLLQAKSNIIIFTSSSINSAVTSMRANISKKPVLTHLNNRNSDGEEGNEAQLERDAIVTFKTSDTPCIVAVEIPRVIAATRLQYDISEELFEACEYHFNKHVFPLNDIAKQVINTLFGYALGGAKGIMLLPAKEMNKLVYLGHLVMISLGYRTLAHAMVARVSTKAKVVQSKNDTVLRLNLKNSPYYKECKSIYVRADSGKIVDAVLDKILTSVLATRYMYNTPPEIWELIGEDTANNVEIEFGAEIGGEFCKFIAAQVS